MKNIICNEIDTNQGGHRSTRPSVHSFDIGWKLNCLREVLIAMRKVIPLHKQSKKAQREYYAKQRESWYGISPVTRTVPSRKTYDRNRIKRETQGD